VLVLFLVIAHVPRVSCPNGLNPTSQPYGFAHDLGWLPLVALPLNVPESRILGGDVDGQDGPGQRPAVAYGALGYGAEADSAPIEVP
jgi:hypothetical protein